MAFFHGFLSIALFGAARGGHDSDYVGMPSSIDDSDDGMLGGPDWWRNGTDSDDPDVNGTELERCPEPIRTHLLGGRLWNLRREEADCANNGPLMVTGYIASDPPKKLVARWHYWCYGNDPSVYISVEPVDLGKPCLSDRDCSRDGSSMCRQCTSTMGCQGRRVCQLNYYSNTNVGTVFERIKPEDLLDACPRDPRDSACDDLFGLLNANTSAGHCLPEEPRNMMWVSSEYWNHCIVLAEHYNQCLIDRFGPPGSDPYAAFRAVPPATLYTLRRLADLAGGRPAPKQCGKLPSSMAATIGATSCAADGR